MMTLVKSQKFSLTYWERFRFILIKNKNFYLLVKKTWSLFLHMSRKIGSFVPEAWDWEIISRHIWLGPIRFDIFQYFFLSNKYKFLKPIYFSGGMVLWTVPGPIPKSNGERLTQANVRHERLMSSGTGHTNQQRKFHFMKTYWHYYLV